MIDMEVKTTDSINWAELTRQIPQGRHAVGSADAASADFSCRHPVGALAPGASQGTELVNALVG